MYKYFPKNTGNSNVIDTLDVTTLNVNGIIYSHGIINNGDLIVNGNSYFHGNTATDGNSTVGGWVRANGGFTTNGINFFDYADGPWVPSFAFIRNAFKDYPLGPVHYYQQDGYYIKSGRQVTVWFKIRANIPDNYRIGSGGVGYSYIAVTDLPFKFNNSDTPIKLSVKSQCTVGEWPNGTAADVVPIVLAPTYPKPYDVIAYEEGTSVDLYSIVISKVPHGAWTADGYTALIYGKVDYYAIALAVPPYALAASSYQPIDNTWIALGFNYDVEFQGSFTYTTDTFP